MAKSSSIYCQVSCNRHKSNRSFGASGGFSLQLYVGASAKNSFDAGEFSVREDYGEGDNKVFSVYWGKLLLKTVTYNTKTKEFLEAASVIDNAIL